MLSELKFKYFLLNDDCILIKGSINGALYDLERGDVFSLNEEEFLILESCEKYEKIGEISKKLQIPLAKISTYLLEVNEIGLGNFYETPVYTDKYLEFYRTDQLPKFNQLNTLIIEPHRRCNLNCTICVGDKVKINKKFIYCGCRKQNNSPILSGDNIKNVIDEAKMFNLQSVFFRGGDPFLYKKDMIDLLFFCKQNVTEVGVHTHSTNLDDVAIGVLKELKISLDIPVYSYNEKIHNNIVNVKGNFKKLISTLEKLLKNSVDFAVILYISAFNSTYIDETVDFFRNLGCRVLHKFIYPDDDVKENNLFLKVYNSKKRDFPKISKIDFLANKEGSYCMPKKMAITAEGNIVPCNIAKDDILGNIKKTSLSEILKEGKLDAYWSISKEKTKICNKCEYRYLCADCPILEHRRENDNFNENKFCKYNLETGTWEI